MFKSAWNKIRGKKKKGLFRGEITWREVTVVLAGLIISTFVWEFMRIYQDEAAKKSAVVMKGIPAECSPEDMNMLQSAKVWWNSYFSWQNDPCEKYHRALHVDPIWEVTPLMVVSSAVTRCITNPLEQIVTSIGNCFNLFFSQIPVLWQPIIVILAIVTAIIFGLIKAGYQISIPLIFSIGPSQQNKTKQGSQNGKNEKMAIEPAKKPGVLKRAKMVLW